VVSIAAYAPNEHLPAVTRQADYSSSTGCPAHGRSAQRRAGSHS